MTITANAGPLMALGKLGLVHLLRALDERVVIPSEVYEEVVTHGLELGQPDAYAVQLAVARDEIHVVHLQDSDLSEAVRVLPLHDGEKHAIQLAINESANWLLLDDWLARESARQLGLKVKGTLGVVVLAQRCEQLSLKEVELIFQAILDRDDIWISDELVKRVWAEVRAARSSTTEE